MRFEGLTGKFEGLTQKVEDLAVAQLKHEEMSAIRNREVDERFTILAESDAAVNRRLDALIEIVREGRNRTANQL